MNTGTAEPSGTSRSSRRRCGRLRERVGDDRVVVVRRSEHQAARTNAEAAASGVGRAQPRVVTGICAHHGAIVTGSPHLPVASTVS